MRVLRSRNAVVAALALVVLLAPAALAAPLYDVEPNGYSTQDGPNGGVLITGLNFLVTCPDGLTFVGRANAISTSGETLFIGKLRGTCTGSSTPNGTFRGESLAETACFADFRVRGQVRFSDGTRIRVNPDTFPVVCL